MARKILLADDSVTAQNMGRKILADAGYEVVTVNNGSAALKRVAEIRPDLIVLDVYMPGYSGLEVCQRLKDAAETAHIPVLLTVGKLEPFKAEEGRRVRADNHIVKPFEASELLSAITRLEDRIVPHQSAGAERFTGKGNNHSESNADSDSGWKSRLSFSSKKKKDEPESNPEEGLAGASFRDFRKGKGKPGTSGTLTTDSPSPTPSVLEPVAHAEPVAAVPDSISTTLSVNVPNTVPGNISPGVSSDVPSDITPEELDALSAVASKLNRPMAEVELTSELPTAVAELPTTSAGELPAAMTGPSALEESAPVVECAAVPAEVPAFAVEGKSEVEIPVESVELAADSATLSAQPIAVECQTNEHQQAESLHPETQLPEYPAEVVVNTAMLAEEAAPVDQSDEPVFASSADAVEHVSVENIEARPTDAVAVSETATQIESTSSEPAVTAAATPEPEESQPETEPEPVHYATSRQEAEELAPSDAELVEALRLLTPSSGSGEMAVPSAEILAAAGQLLAVQAALTSGDGPRWIAEPMVLSPEEAAMSLEAEMTLTLAAVQVSQAVDEVDPAKITGLSAIAAAVDNRLAEANLVATEVSVEHTANCESCEQHSYGQASNEQTSELPPAEPLAIEAPVEAMAADSPSAIATNDENHTENVPEEAPKAMAAAASDSSTTASATDASTIASIVDSVMADLRPRIVEEIARKLAKKE